MLPGPDECTCGAVRWSIYYVDSKSPVPVRYGNGMWPVCRGVPNRVDAEKQDQCGPCPNQKRKTSPPMLKNASHFGSSCEEDYGCVLRAYECFLNRCISKCHTQVNDCNS